MKTELAIAAVCAAACVAVLTPVNAPAQAGVEENTDDLVGEIITEAVKVIEEEGWTAQDVGDAIRSLRGLYIRDNSSTEGRRRWHGKIVETAVDTNTMVRTTTYEDGEVFEDEARVVTPKNAAERQLARLASTTNAGPARLNAARKRLLKNKSDEAAGVVSNVTVSVIAGGK